MRSNYDGYRVILQELYNSEIQELDRDMQDNMSFMSVILLYAVEYYAIEYIVMLSELEVAAI
jgi:hypothetical protein